jgi:tetratricopeptide (TPR) repeat protein
MEMSPYPETALPAADRLRLLMPDASHMLHMPTHIDIACGDYRRGVDSNHQAMLADDAFFARSEGSPLYIVSRVHNIHVKLYSAMMSGRFTDALSAAHRISGILTDQFLSIRSPPMADWTESYLGAIVHVLVRFGRWADLLKLPLPEDRELYCSTTSMIYYGRSVALAVLGLVDNAKLEQAKFECARSRVPQSRLNTLPTAEVDLLNVASAMLRGEIEYREGKFESSFQTLRQATVLEDNLPYGDPPPWLQPTRHALGALLLEQGRVEEAEVVYREDLGLGGQLPRRKARLNNVWGLHGLHEALLKTGKVDEARIIGLHKDIALASADIPIAASCFCRISSASPGDDVRPVELSCCVNSIDVDKIAL